MTSLIQVDMEAVRERSGESVSVFGVPWPAYKAVAVVAAFVVALAVLALTASGVAAMWSSAAVLVAVWWGGYALSSRRWDHGARDYYAENRTRR